MTTDAGLNLFVQYCNTPNPARQQEFDTCVRRNLAHPFVQRVYNFTDARAVVPDEFTSHPKWMTVPLGHWVRYRDLVDFANAQCFDQLVGFGNLDTFLDEASPWGEVPRLLQDGKIILCLSRHETDLARAWRDPQFEQTGYAVSQDFWLFKAPVRLPDIDFELGIAGCDNAIAERIKRGGYIPVNYGSRFRVFHYDVVSKKTGANSLEFHRKDRARRPDRRPEEQGQYLLPDVGRYGSVDELLRQLNLTDLQKYVLICDLISSAIRINNR